MRSGTFAVALAAAVIVGGIAFAFIRNAGVANVVKPTAPPESGVQPSAGDVVHVDDLAANPQQFAGRVVLKGAVAGVNRSESVFGVIDAREFERCGVVTCAANTLPVKYAGALPEPKTIVRITGSVAQEDKGLVIEATQVEVVP